MKIKSVSGFTLFVADIEKSNKFYSDLGFLQSGKPTAERASFRLNWFFVDLVSQKSANDEFSKEANAKEKGAGLYIYLSVDDVDSIYKEVLEKGLKPSSEPRDWPWGNREFVLRDPDGYKLVFFQKK